MGRVAQPAGTKGSLRWIQAAIEQSWRDLETPILEASRARGPIKWLSPLREDSYAEYRDRAFLELLGLDHLAGSLADFWPARGPQWDALALGDGGQVYLIEAKAHVAEMCSPACQASEETRPLILRSLKETAAALGARDGRAPWDQFFYQLTNRLAHLRWLRNNGVDGYLVLVNFLNDRQMRGPSNAETWHAAYEVAMHVIGLPKRHPLSAYVIHAYPDVSGRSS